VNGRQQAAHKFARVRSLSVSFKAFINSRISKGRYKREICLQTLCVWGFEVTELAFIPRCDQNEWPSGTSTESNKSPLTGYGIVALKNQWLGIVSNQPLRR
jgi:hypothetical protein